MRKYGGKYGTRKHSKDVSSQIKFDLAVAVVLEGADSEGSSQSSENSSQTSSRRDGKYKKKEVTQANKRRKVVPLYKDDLFGFTEEDFDVSTSKPGTSLHRKTSKQKTCRSPKKTVFESSADCTDKSTDDEAYGSSQSQEPQNNVANKEVKVDQTAGGTDEQSQTKREVTENR